MTVLRRTATLGHLVAALLVVTVAAVALCLVARSAIDRAGDRADLALSRGASLSVRVDGLEALKPQVDDALAQARDLADRIQAGLAVDVSGLRSAVDSLVGAVRDVPALAAQASEAAAAQVAALLDTAKGIVADLGRAVAPVGALANGVPVNVSVAGTARVDVHVLAPLVDDLLGLLPQILAHLGAASWANGNREGT